jgi:16S rRNA (guanine527-N7)-methyltransferase
MAAVEIGEFSDRIQACSAELLSTASVESLYAHYRLLLRWSDRVSLVGPGTLDDAIEVHYGESLAALPILRSAAKGTLVDVGSGAGFPGFVLAAARPDLAVTLVESRERKWSFLKASALESGVDVECLLGTVDRSLPAGFPARVEWVTLRALKLPARAWQTIASRLSNDGRVLVWAGREDPAIPEVLRIRSSVPLPGSRWKRILELEPA